MAAEEAPLLWLRELLPLPEAGWVDWVSSESMVSELVAADEAALGFFRVPRTFLNWSSDKTTNMERIWPGRKIITKNHAS